MGKQRSKAKTKGTRPTSTNSYDWEIRVRELVATGIVSPLTLDRPHLHEITRRTT